MVSFTSNCLTRAHHLTPTVIGVVAQIFGWAFATLFIAGFTAAVRKT